MGDQPDGKEQAGKQPANRNNPADRYEFLFFICVEIILGALANFLVIYLPIFIIFIIAMVALAAYFFWRWFIHRHEEENSTEPDITIEPRTTYEGIPVYPRQEAITIKEVQVWYVVRGNKMGDKVIKYSDNDNVYDKAFETFPAIARRRHRVTILGNGRRISSDATFRSIKLAANDVLIIT